MSDDVSSDEGDRRLFVLCWEEKWAEADALLKSSSAAKRKELVRYRNEYGRSALYWCACGGGAPLSLVRAILNACPSIINAPTKGGWTAAMCASYFGHAGMLALLIKRGANLSIRHGDGTTARDWAVQEGKEGAYDAVLDAWNTTLALAMSLKHYDLLHIEQVMTANPDVLHPDIVKLAQHDYLLVNPHSSSKKGARELSISGMMLHDIYGKEEGIMRLIFEFLSGER